MKTNEPETQILSIGQTISKRWKITKIIGGGGFGEIYKAFDLFWGVNIAMKVESNFVKRHILRLEVPILKKLQHTKHVCKFYEFGMEEKFSYIAMSLQGKNLSELRREQPKHTFSISTTLRMGLQMLLAIEDLHRIGYLHRDIKPSNFAMGLQGVSMKRLFLLDFGLARKFRTINANHINGDALLLKTYGFRGTVRYASCNMHRCGELGRVDDMWSTFYVLIEMRLGRLPWTQIRDRDVVSNMKTKYDYKQLLMYLPREFTMMYHYLLGLSPEKCPNYNHLRQLLSWAMKRYNVLDNEPYDWEIMVPFDPKCHLPQQQQQQQVHGSKQTNITDSNQSQQLQHQNQSEKHQPHNLPQQHQQYGPAKRPQSTSEQHQHMLRKSLHSFTQEAVSLKQHRHNRSDIKSQFKVKSTSFQRTLPPVGHIYQLNPVTKCVISTKRDRLNNVKPVGDTFGNKIVHTASLPNSDKVSLNAINRKMIDRLQFEPRLHQVSQRIHRAPRLKSGTVCCVNLPVEQVQRLGAFKRRRSPPQRSRSGHHMQTGRITTKKLNCEAAGGDKLAPQLSGHHVTAPQRPLSQVIAPEQQALTAPDGDNPKNVSLEIPSASIGNSVTVTKLQRSSVDAGSRIGSVKEAGSGALKRLWGRTKSQDSSLQNLRDFTSRVFQILPPSGQKARTLHYGGSDSGNHGRSNSGQLMQSVSSLDQLKRLNQLSKNYTSALRQRLTSGSPKLTSCASTPRPPNCQEMLGPNNHHMRSISEQAGCLANSRLY